MVRVVLAGGAGNVGREILDVLLAQGKHKVIVFSRDAVPDLAARGVTVVKVDYLDNTALVDALRGVDTVLSFLVELHDPEHPNQKALIDACIEAKVRRFAPSEWATKAHSGIRTYEWKDKIYEYLRSINREQKVLEFTLFQPGLFLNYFTYPKPSTKYMHIMPMLVDVENCRAIALKNTKAQITLTTIQDVARIVPEALDYEGLWPEVGGIRANRIPVLEFIKLCEDIRGQKFNTEFVERTDLEAGKLTSSWVPVLDHPAIPEEIRDSFSREYFAAVLLSFEKGAWDVADTWNLLLPSFHFTGVEEFLRDFWA